MEGHAAFAAVGARLPAGQHVRQFVLGDRARAQVPVVAGRAFRGRGRRGALDGGGCRFAQLGGDLQAVGVAHRDRAGLLGVPRGQQLVEVQRVADVLAEVLGGRVFLGRRRQEIDAAVEAHVDVVIADAQAVAVAQLDRALAGGRLVRIVDVDAVGADVLQPVRAAAVLDLEVVTRDDALGVWQHPVVVGRAADGPAVDAEHAASVLGEVAVLFADDSELDGHDAVPARPSRRVPAGVLGLTPRRDPCNMRRP